jgi:competence protein ComEA
MKLIKPLFIALSLTISLVFSHISFAAEPVNINTADAKVISKALVGIGLSKADAIVKYRTTHGNFTNINELEKVKGIGKSTVEKNKVMIKL